LKTFGGLLKIEAATGDIIFEQNDFDGPGIVDVRYLENGDYLVLSGGRNIADLAGSNAYHLARLTRDGDIVWISEHNGRRTAGMFVADHTVLVDGYPTEAYDLIDGTKLWENDNRRGNDYHHTIIDGDYVYFASDLRGTTTRISESKVFKQELRTGEIIWQTDVQNEIQVSGVPSFKMAYYWHGDRVVHLMVTEMASLPTMPIPATGYGEHLK
jgi:outer membrane protein assembly factor BamB